MSARHGSTLVLTTLALSGASCGPEHRIDPGPPSYRTVTATRATGGEPDLSVRVRFAAGKFRLAPSDGSLYRASLRYDERRFTPLMAYDQDDRELEIGISAGRMGGNLDLDEQQLELALTPEVPIDLRLELGALESAIELGGLMLTDISLKTGASQTRGIFSAPNRTACRDFVVQVGAAELELLGLANSRCARFDVAGGAGQFTLDFTGDWGELTEIRVDLKFGAGELVLRFPESVGVEIDMEKFLAGFSGERLTRVGRRHVSDGFDTAATKILVDVSAALGEISVEWVGEEP